MSVPNILDIKVVIHLLSSIITGIRYRRKQTHLNKIIIAFFDFTRKCPESIPDCETLREAFIDEINKYKKYGTCSNCDIQYIRNKFINTLKQTIKHE